MTFAEYPSNLGNGPFILLCKQLVIGIALLLISTACESSEDPVPIERSTNGITGVVADELGNVYANASLNLSRNASFISTQTTNRSGEFQFPGLELGNYELTLVLPKTTTSSGANPKSVNLQDVAGVSTDFTINAQPYPADVVLGDDDILGEVRTETGEIPSDPEDLLYAVNVFSDQMLVPILAPDQHHIKMSEWQTAQGSVTMRCMGDTSSFEFDFSGLIPEGVYTLWIAPMNQMEILGTGAIGLPDGSQNKLNVDANGDGAITLTMGTGDLSAFGTLSTCALTAETTMAIILDYHIDGQTYGSIAGPDHTEVGHMIFIF